MFEFNCRSSRRLREDSVWGMVPFSQLKLRSTNESFGLFRKRSSGTDPARLVFVRINVSRFGALNFPSRFPSTGNRLI